MDRPVELRTERLLLRPFRPDDLDDLVEFTSSPEWGRYLINLPFPYTRKDAEKSLAIFTAPANWEKLQMFAIVLDGKVIGEVYTNSPHPPNEGAELGYDLSREHWGKGLAAEAARTIVSWAFQTYGYYRIFATCDPRNVSSSRVLEKLGFKQEGHLRRHILWNGEVRDQLYYGILREEWKS